MEDSEKKEIISKYNGWVDKYGVTPQALGWMKERHNLRFDVLLSFWDLKNMDILDFGCGFGDMSQYCKERKFETNYKGYDINELLIEKGKEKYPDIDISVVDFLDQEDGKEDFDYIFSSGVHNFTLNDNWGFIKKTFDVFYKNSKYGFALNFISNRVDEDFKKDHVYYADPIQILELAYTYSNKVLFRNDYMPFEFSIFVDKEDTFDKDKVVYHNFIERI